MIKQHNVSPLYCAIQSAKVYFIYAAIFSFFVNLLMLVPALYMLNVYDRVLASGSNETLVFLTLIAIFLLVSMGFLEFVRSRIMIRASTYIDQLLGAKVFDAAFKQSLYTGGSANTQALSDLNNVRQFLTGNSLFAFFDAPWVPVYLFVMYLFHPLFGLVGLIAAVCLLTLTWVNEKSTSTLLLKANNEAKEASFSASSNLRNTEVIESMGMLNTVREHWQTKQNRSLAMQVKASDRGAVFLSASKAMRQILQSLILALGAYLAINGNISPGLMIAGSILLGRALAPIDQMTSAWKGFITARGQLSYLDNLLNSMPDNKEKMKLPAPQGDLSAENLTVLSPETRGVILKGINLNIKAGQFVGVIGPSGAGKSTFAKALLGIWPAMNGKMRLDGADIFQWDKSILGQYIGYLPQDIELFNGTIADNIARFNAIDADKVVEAARKVGVHDMILKLPNGYDSQIGVGGSMLSGGQRQRIGLARALYDNPRIVVLDEPNSNLDDAGEKTLIQTLLNLKNEGKTTVVIITHKPAVLPIVDKVLVLKAGMVAAFDDTQKIIANAQKS